MNRRHFLTTVGLLATTALVGCETTGEDGTKTTSKLFTSDYGRVKDAGYTIPAVPINRVKKRFHRQIVSYKTKYRSGTIIVDTPKRFLYFVLPGGKAVRYGIGVGRAGFAWKGEAYIAWKRQWPTWTPPAEMIKRQPELKKYADGGMDPGLKNPLGARALYLFDKNGNDTLYRLHGTPQWKSIGTAASSGCIRLINQDIIDLYKRVRPGRRAKVVVLQA